MLMELPEELSNNQVDLNEDAADECREELAEHAAPMLVDFCASALCVPEATSMALAVRARRGVVVVVVVDVTRGEGAPWRRGP